MRNAPLSIRARLDRLGLLVSGLCAVHCVAGLLLVAGLGLGGQLLFAPVVHRVGLVLAIVVGAITLGLGVLRHGDRRPLQLGFVGLVMMAAAMFVPHGTKEAVLTLGGVVLLGWAHWRNLRLGR